MTTTPVQTRHTPIDVAYKHQAVEIDRKMAELRQRRRNGYRGPLTRAELAARARIGRSR